MPRKTWSLAFLLRMRLILALHGVMPGDAIRHAVRWLRLHAPPDLHDADFGSTTALFTWLHARRRDGPALVRRVACRVVMQEFLFYDLKRQVKDTYACCQKAGVIFDIPPEIEQHDAPLVFTCHLCP